MFIFTYFNETTALHMAVNSDNVEIVELLLNTKNIDINVENEIKILLEK